MGTKIVMIEVPGTFEDFSRKFREWIETTKEGKNLKLKGSGKHPTTLHARRSGFFREFKENTNFEFKKVSETDGVTTIRSEIYLYQGRCCVVIVIKKAIQEKHQSWSLFLKAMNAVGAKGGDLPSNLGDYESLPL